MNAKDVILARRMGGGGGGSVPKPLTYDYMPEGYPKRGMGAVTVMAEQEVAFEVNEYVGFVTLPNPIEIVEGQTYTVKWDGTEYECVGTKMNQDMALGNQSIDGEDADTGEPFLYIYNIKQQAGIFETFDKSASHTISVQTAMEVIIPMSEDFLPTTAKNTTVFYV